MEIILAARHVSKSYGAAPIIRGLGFTFHAGEFVSLVGPSGCGKTTLLMCLAGLLPIDAGVLTFQGKPVVGVPDGMAVVFQDYSRSLFPWKTNLENVRFGTRRSTGLSRANATERARALIDAVGLSGYEDHYPWQLSGGMQQRIAIARGLASQSRLLLLDEPLAAVDAQTRADLQDLLLSLAQRFNQTCLLVTHDVDEAVYMADRVLVLAPRPTQIDMEVRVELRKARDQISSREEPEFLRARHEILSRIRAMRKPGVTIGDH